MNKNIILSLDQGTTISGYAVFQNGALTASGVLKAKAKDKVEDRMFDMAAQINEVINSCQPNEIIVEEPFAKVNIRVFQILCKFLGMVLYMGHIKNIPVISYGASVWRSEIGLKGKNRPEQKQKAIDYVKEKFNIECTDDEAEAILIGTAHLSRIK